MSDAQPRDRCQFIIVDPLGLHVRTASKLAVLAKSFRSEIQIIANGTTADGKNLVDLVALAIECGTTLDIVAQGSDAEAAVAALTSLVRGSLGGSLAAA